MQVVDTQVTDGIQRVAVQVDQCIEAILLASVKQPAEALSYCSLRSQDGHSLLLLPNKPLTEEVKLIYRKCDVNLELFFLWHLQT